MAGRDWRDPDGTLRTWSIQRRDPVSWLWGTVRRCRGSYRQACLLADELEYQEECLAYPRRWPEPEPAAWRVVSDEHETA